MKKFLILCSLSAIMLGSSCVPAPRERHTSTISLSQEESDFHYKISAVFDPGKQEKVEALLDKYLRADGDPSFVNTQLDAQMTGNDKRTYHIKLAPGKLALDLDKTKNTQTTVNDLKKLCAELNAITQ